MELAVEVQLTHYDTDCFEYVVVLQTFTVTVCYTDH